MCCFVFKQKTAYELRISDWSSDVCSSDLQSRRRQFIPRRACCSPRNRPFSAEQAPKVPLSTDRRKSAMELPAPPSRRLLPSQKRPRQHFGAEEQRSEERGVGEDCVRMCRYMRSTDH